MQIRVLATTTCLVLASPVVAVATDLARIDVASSHPNSVPQLEDPWEYLRVGLGYSNDGSARMGNPLPLAEPSEEAGPSSLPAQCSSGPGITRVSTFDHPTSYTEVIWALGQVRAFDLEATIECSGIKIPIKPFVEASHDKKLWFVIPASRLTWPQLRRLLGLHVHALALGYKDTTYRRNEATGYFELMRGEKRILSINTAAGALCGYIDSETEEDQKLFGEYLKDSAIRYLVKAGDDAATFRTWLCTNSVAANNYSASFREAIQRLRDLTRKQVELRRQRLDAEIRALEAQIDQLDSEQIKLKQKAAEIEHKRKTIDRLLGTPDEDLIESLLREDQIVEDILREYEKRVGLVVDRKSKSEITKALIAYGRLLTEEQRKLNDRAAGKP